MLSLFKLISVCVGLVIYAPPIVALNWTIVTDFNAVPDGTRATTKSLQNCEDMCTNDCNQFSWNSNSHHCYLSTSDKWSGTTNPRVTSGCRPDKVKGCGVGPTPPKYDGVVRPTADGRLEAYMIPPFDANHASFIEHLPNNGYAIAWFSCPKSEGSLCKIVYASLGNDTTNWTKAKILSERDGYSNQNAVLHSDPSSGLLLFHSQQKSGSTDETHAQIWHARSIDGLGMNWTTPEALFTEPGSFPKNRVLSSLNGTLWLPMYYAISGKKNQYSAIKTSAHHGLGKDADWGEMSLPSTNYLVQPSCLRLKPDKPNLQCYFRDRRAEWIYRSTSNDDGVHWTKPYKTVLVNNNAGIHATSLASGRIALICNPTTKSRADLALFLSEDNGDTWKYKRALEGSIPTGHPNLISGRPLSAEYSYPTMLQVTDGKIHISYTYLRQTIKYVVLDEDWIMHG